MNKLMYRFVATRKKKKKKKKEIDPFLDTVCPLRASCVKKIPDRNLDTSCPAGISCKKNRNRPVFRHGMPPQGNPRKNRESVNRAKKGQMKVALILNY